jgi:predicted membrane-bound dolichyl-phosphate-mannose-protein mannosyltransferase
MENIFTVAKPFLTFAKILGVFPMSFDGAARRGLLKIHWRDFIFTVITLSALLAILFFATLSRNFFTMVALDGSKTTFEGWNVIMKLSNIVALCQVLYQLCKSKNIVKLLNLLQNFDLKVKISRFLS